MQLSANTLLQGGKYRIVRFIDSGGFGCTYNLDFYSSNHDVGWLYRYYGQSVRPVSE